MRELSMGLVFSFVLLTAKLGAAQQPAQEGAVAVDAIAESEPAPPDESEARALFHAGQSAYESGRFEKALEYFLQAHELSGRPALLYNVGQAADRARRDETALNAFRMYLQQVPDAPNAEMVQNRIASLEIAVDNARARSLVEPTPPARTTAPTMAVQPVSTDPAQRPLDAAPLHEQWWFWGGIGAAVVVTVVVIALASSGGNDSVARPPAGSDGVVVLTLGGP